MFFGYPERDPYEYRAFNSMYVVSETGALLKNYRKHNLFSTEYSWATAGNSYEYLDIYFWRIARTIRCGLAICMDIWMIKDASYEAMEFATFHKNSKSQLIIGMANWPDYQLYLDETIKCEIQKSYWLNRLIPLFTDKEFVGNRYFIWSDRSG